MIEENKGAKIKNRYNQVPHLTQDSDGKVTNSQLDTTNKSQEVRPFLAGDHKAQINIARSEQSSHTPGGSHQRLKHFQRKDKIVKYFIILNQVVSEKTLMKMSICVK